MFLQLTANESANQILCVCVCVVTSKVLKRDEKICCGFKKFFPLRCKNDVSEQCTVAPIVQWR